MEILSSPDTRRVAETYYRSRILNSDFRQKGLLLSSRYGMNVSVRQGQPLLPFGAQRFDGVCSFSLRRGYISQAARKRSSESTFLYLTVLVFGMVGCTYAAVPLYRRFCQATGYGGTVQRRESVEEKIARHAKDGITASREIVVQFNADIADGMPWKFVPTQREVRVKPGESALAFYTAENRSSTPIIGMSTYNVTPMKKNSYSSGSCLIEQFEPLREKSRSSLVESFFLTPEKLMGVANKAAVYFNKIQCFCFEEQRLLPGEQIDMPTPLNLQVFFYIDPEFETDPRMDGINNIILSIRIDIRMPGMFLLPPAAFRLPLSGEP
ncbi:Cytochrome c oxidase assembly protein cox11, mitochondrial [Asimina triloba]